MAYFYSFQGVLTDRSLFPLEIAYVRLEKQSIFNVAPCKVILDQYTCSTKNPVPRLSLLPNPKETVDTQANILVKERAQA